MAVTVLKVPEVADEDPEPVEVKAGSAEAVLPLVVVLILPEGADTALVETGVEDELLASVVTDIVDVAADDVPESLALDVDE